MTHSDISLYNKGKWYINIHKTVYLITCRTLQYTIKKIIIIKKKKKKLTESGTIWKIFLNSS